MNNTWLTQAIALANDFATAEAIYRESCGQREAIPGATARSINAEDALLEHLKIGASLMKEQP